jgi:putative DNA primase/helicase
VTLSELLSRLDGVEEEADGWVARCPAHTDGRPSLRVAQSDEGKILLHCRAGCRKDAVLEALGLTWADLFQETPDASVPAISSAPLGPPSAGEVAALGQYLGECADRLARAIAGESVPHGRDAVDYVRARFGLDDETMETLSLGVDPGGRTSVFESLGLAYRRVPRLVVPFRGFDGVARGVQARDLTGGDPVRWCGPNNPESRAWSRLAVFVAGTDRFETIVTEGPGDALSAVGAGYSAVAVRGAALSHSADLLAELVEGLRGRTVILAGDGDAAGQEFNRAIGEALAEAGLQVRVLALPSGVSDLTAWRESAGPGFEAALSAAIRESVPPGAVPTSAPAPPTSFDDRRFRLTDLGNAERLAHALDGRVLFSPEVGFYLYDGATWSLDRFDAVRAAAQEVTREMTREAARMLDDPRLSSTDRDYADALKSWASRSQSTNSITAMVRELSAMPGVVTDVEAMDSHNHLLTFRNGVVDLRTGKLLPHSPQYRMTRRIEVDYDPAAECPTWETFLTQVFPSAPGLPDYMRRLVGYGITGETDEQCFAVLWGTGSNGKSVFTDTLTEVFRAVSTTTPFSTFEDRPSGGIPNDLAALKGARLVFASEGERGRAMAEAVIKRVTGKDLIAARFMRKEFFEFRPTFLIFLATNHRPSFKGQDEGLWRRVKLIPWTRYFAPEERDHYLSRKLQDEAAGIAAWAVRGAVEWYASGLQDPRVVVDATRGYRETSDALSGFLPGRLIQEKGAEVLGADAYHSYLEWCDEEGLQGKEIWTRRAFYGAMEERGIHRRHGRQGQVLMGARLATPAEQISEPARTSEPAGAHLRTVSLDDAFKEPQ